MNYSRRDFLRNAAAVAACAATTGVAAAAPATSPASYSGPVIDTHTHFYDPTRALGVPWPPKNDKLLYRRVLPEDYRALPQPRPVSGTVVVEASAWLEDNQWILDLAAREPFIVGFIGNLPVGTDDFKRNLDRFSANPLFRGIRIGGDRVKRALADQNLQRDLKLLADKDLAVDVLGGVDMLPDVARLADAVPALRMIIDHVANIPINGKPVDPAWRDGMESAGQRKSVYCKVSGLVEGSGRTDGRAPDDQNYYRPVLDAIWSAFGSDRLVYGSNWPVSERFAPCGVVQKIVSDYFNGKGQTAAEKVLFRNSQSAYKWALRAK
jgi:predicted TIM-barrel fold metal-dependent hydrolase